ncbi:MAG TPA: phosphatidate cytidylyltransferase [Acidocella sp.]|nr:phosphatidate cytidylyltransferase [Acidocella sp.]
MSAPKSSKWSDFGIRAASAAVLGPIALLCLAEGDWAWRALIGVALVGLGLEWGKLAQLRRPILLGAMLGVVWICGVKGGVFAGLLAVLAMSVLAGFSLSRFAAYGIPYAGIGGVSLLWLRLQPGAGLIDTLFLVVVIWSTDIGAYLVGRLIGGPKLAPRISPGKTWSGSLGGLLIGGLAGALLAGRGHGIVLAALPAGFLLSVFAQSGDLLESAIKRKLGVKDSGNTIPGHGGLFDRLDGFLTAAPVAVILALSVHGGVPLWG